MSERFQNGDTIPITVTALSGLRIKVIGLTDVLLTIRRNSDDYYLDFDDSTFKASGWTTRQKVMGEKSAAYSPGVYFYDWVTAGFSDDNYHIEISSASAANSPWASWMYVGGYANNLDTPVSFIADLIELQRGSHTAQGDHWYVGPYGGNDTTGDGSKAFPYKTVAKAQAMATDNNHDLIILLADDPTGPTTLTEQVTISKNYLFIRGPGRDFFWNYDANGDVITVTGTGVELSGFVLNTHNAGSGDAINISGDFCRVHNVWIEYAQQYGIYIENASWCQIHGNTIFNTGKDAASAGIYVFQSGGGTALHNKIFDNNIEDNTGVGVEVAGATEDVVIKHNNIHGSSTWGVLIGSGALTTGVYDNTFSDNASGNLSNSGTDTYTQNNEQWAKGGVVLTGAEMNKIADHVARRNNANIEASSDGDALAFGSPYGATAKLTNDIDTTSNPGKLTIFKQDGVETLGKQTLTTDPQATPIIGADTD